MKSDLKPNCFYSNNSPAMALQSYCSSCEEKVCSEIGAKALPFDKQLAFCSAHETARHFIQPLTLTLMEIGDSDNKASRI